MKKEKTSAFFDDRALEEMKNYLEEFSCKLGFASAVRYDIRSSDSNSFVEAGVPAVSFARYAVGDTAPIHNRYDTMKNIDSGQLLADCEYICKFTQSACDMAEGFPKKIGISDKIKSAVEEYMKNKVDIL